MKVATSGPASGGPADSQAGPGEASGATEITVGVRLFAELKERAGVGRAQVRVPAGSAVGAVWGALPPRLSDAPQPPSLAFAINHVWAHAGATLRDGDEVALLLPGSGG